MAQKKTYIYRVWLGKHGDVFEDIFMYARNQKTAIDYCKEKSKEKKYDLFRANKVGISHELRETEIIQGYTAEKLRNSLAGQDTIFSEREIESPKFISKEEMEELSL